MNQINNEHKTIMLKAQNSLTGKCHRKGRYWQKCQWYLILNCIHIQIFTWLIATWPSLSFNRLVACTKKTDCTMQLFYIKCATKLASAQRNAYKVSEIFSVQRLSNVEYYLRRTIKKPPIMRRKRWKIICLIKQNSIE